MSLATVNTKFKFSATRLSAQLFPAPGPVLGVYPEKKNRERSSWNQISDWCDRRVEGLKQSGNSRYAGSVQSVLKLRSEVPNASSAEFFIELQKLRLLTRKQGLQGDCRLKLMAFVCNALEAKINRSPYPQQIEAALAMLDARLVEMATGEGKTIAVFLAASCAALAGSPVHLVSANAYLAERDALEFDEVVKLLGISTGVLEQKLDRSVRAQIYRKDIVYATASELIFDYLNDQLDHRKGLPRVMRGLCFAIVDEADSVLLDEARTPFVIASLRHDPDFIHNLRLCFALAKTFVVDRDFSLDVKRRIVRLTDQGQVLASSQAQDYLGVWKASRGFREDLIKQALTGLYVMQRDSDYVVHENEVAIIDQNTGRIAEGRRWSNGLHQLVEIKEALEPSSDQGTSAQLTFQRFFPRYLHLSGTSATLCEAKSELHKLYRLFIHKVNPRLPIKRQSMGARVFSTSNLQFEAIVKNVVVELKKGRAVLVGTDSVEQSFLLHQFLKTKLPDYPTQSIQLLNASESKTEALLVAQAGQQGMITVATNMAGRGTDIKLAQSVRAAGGLHVISTQANSSKRIDRQLAGRSGRQGDPGSVITFLSLDTGLLVRYANGGMLATVVRLTYQRYGEYWHRLLRFYESRKHRQHRAQLVQQDLQFERQMSFGGRSE
jgi:preprotein translocase subunit SecA